MAAVTGIETETEATAVAATIGRDSTTVKGMMILANEGISLVTTSGLLGGFPRFSISASAFSFSLRWGKARHFRLTLPQQLDG